MKQLAIAMLALCALTLGVPALAHDHDAAGMEVTGGPWVRATPPGRNITAGYLTIRNNSSEARRIVGAASPVAGRVELHTHVHDAGSGMMQMRQVDAIDVPAGETVELAPGGLHLMIMDLERGLEPGMSVPLTLEFDDGSRLEMEAPVRRGEEAMEMHQSQDQGNHGNHHHGH